MSLSNSGIKDRSADLVEYLSAINSATRDMLVGVMASIDQDIESDLACNGQDKHPKVSNTGKGFSIAKVVAFDKAALKEKLGAK